MKRTKKPATGNRCSECGIAVARGPFAAPGQRAWTRCDQCRAANPEDRRAAALARAGVEHRASDPAVLVAMRRTRWRAEAVEQRRALAAAEKAAGPPVRGVPASARAADVQREIGRLGSTVGEPGAQPWEHVSPREVRAAIEQAREDLARASAPKPCREGPCGVCGVRLAPRWWGPVAFGATGGLSSTRPPRWAVCAACWPLLEAAGGDPTSWRARKAWTASVLGRPASPPDMSMPSAVRPYALWLGAVDPREAAGVETPWSWVSEADLNVLALRAPQHREPGVLAREDRARAAQARLRAAEAARRPRSALDGATS